MQYICGEQKPFMFKVVLTVKFPVVSCDKNGLQYLTSHPVTTTAKNTMKMTFLFC